MRATKTVLLLMALSVAASIAFAGVFVYYPVKVSVNMVEPPIVFDAGGNANATDLSGNILVTISENHTRAGIALHPTYQWTYYQDILHINNTGSTPYYVYIRVVDPVDLPPNSNASLKINGTVVDLTTENITSLGELNPGEILMIDAEFYIPGGTNLVESNVTIQLIYSPENTQPPELGG